MFDFGFCLAAMPEFASNREFCGIIPPEDDRRELPASRDIEDGGFGRLKSSAPVSAKRSGTLPPSFLPEFERLPKSEPKIPIIFNSVE